MKQPSLRAARYVMQEEAHVQGLRSMELCFTLGRPVERGEWGESFPGPRDVWGAPPSLKNTENGVPDGFFLTSNMHKIHFRPGLCPGPRWRNLRRSPGPLVTWCGGIPPHVSSLSAHLASQSRHRIETVIGPHDNALPGPAVALDGPDSRYLVNDEQTTKHDPRNSSAFGRLKLRSYFLPFVDQSIPN